MPAMQGKADSLQPFPSLETSFFATFAEAKTSEQSHLAVEVPGNNGKPLDVPLISGVPLSAEMVMIANHIQMEVDFRSEMVMIANNLGSGPYVLQRAAPTRSRPEGLASMANSQGTVSTDANNETVALLLTGVRSGSSIADSLDGSAGHRPVG